MTPAGRRNGEVHRWVEHTGELELEIEGDTEQQVFVEAADALRELLGEADEEGPAKTVTMAAPDRARLFAAWLGELAYLAETDGLVPERVSDFHLGDGVVSATIHGRYGDPPHLVKAVTYHRLAFERHGGRWQGRAVLDV
jgi:SHS2 domain-containing protein